MAQKFSNVRKERFPPNRKSNPCLERFIKEKLESQQWSPKQIRGYCQQNDIPMVSHQLIYQFIYQDKDKGGELYKNLRSARKKYRNKYGNGKTHHGIKNRASIDLHPPIVNNKERFGDWEIDTIVRMLHFCLSTSWTKMLWSSPENINLHK